MLGLEREIDGELLRHPLTDQDVAEPLQVGDPFEEQQAVDDLFGVFHLSEGFFSKFFPEPQISPICTHFRMQEVLIDGGELGREYVVE
jgi:hypothetical protein